MFIKDGIAYAGEPTPLLCVCSARPLTGYRLDVVFSDGARRIVDLSPLLSAPAFAPLRDHAAFDRIGIENGVMIWNDGEIDISPEWLYENGCEVAEG